MTLRWFLGNPIPLLVHLICSFAIFLSSLQEGYASLDSGSSTADSGAGVSAEAVSAILYLAGISRAFSASKVAFTTLIGF